MPQEQFANQPSTTLNGNINNSTPTIVVTSNANFPSLAQFRIGVGPSSSSITEIMTVTAGQGGTSWTVTRASEILPNGTQTAVSHSSGDTVVQILTTGGLTNAIALPVAGASWGANTLLTLNSVANNYGLSVAGPSGAGTSFGILVAAGTNSTDFAARFQTQALVDIIKFRGDGTIIANGPIITPPSISGTVPTTGYGSVLVKIDDNLFGGSATTYTAPNPLPTGFRHLILDINARCDNAATFNQPFIRFNNDSTSGHYGWQDLKGSGSTASASESGVSAQTGITVNTVPAANALTGASGFVRIIIPNYNQTTFAKICDISANDFIGTTMTSTSQLERHVGNGFWNSTAAITRIDVIAGSSANFIAGTSFVLYGVP